VTDDPDPIVELDGKQMHLSEVPARRRPDAVFTMADGRRVRLYRFGDDLPTWPQPRPVQPIDGAS
jgi:hypothetical protein